MADKPLIIIGSGIAGYSLAREFRKLDKQRALIVVTADDGHFYSKPNLSNAFTHKKTAASMISSNVEKMRSDLSATIYTDCSVENIDPNNRRITFSKNEHEYGDLVLALGALPRRLSKDIDPEQIALSVNSRIDFERYEQRVAVADHITIIGSGLIGCEFANDLAAHGKKVSVIGPSSLPLQPLLPENSANAIKSALANIGVEWKLGSALKHLNVEQGKVAVSLENGEKFKSDLVVSAIGLTPNLSLAKYANLATNIGIVVDQYMQTSREHIYAIGDCAEIDGQVQPFVMPIMQQARALAKTLCGEKSALHYPLMPIVIKTPACHTVVLPPPRGTTGIWQTETPESGTVSLFIDSAKKLRGFALTGAATHQRAQLLKQCEADAIS